MQYSVISDKLKYRSRFNYPRSYLTYARAALVVQIAQAREAVLAAGAGDQVALAALREHALAHDAGTDRLVARFRAFRRGRQQQNPDGGRDE